MKAIQRVLVATTAVAMVFTPSVAMARGFSSSGGSHSYSSHSAPSYSGSRSGSYSSGSRTGTKAPSYSGAKSGTSRSTSKAPSYSGAKTGTYTHTGSGPSSLPRSVRTTTVYVLPAHPAYGSLYHGHYFYRGAYYPYYYDGSYYMYDPAGYRVHHGLSAVAIVVIVVLSLGLIGGMIWFFRRRPTAL